MPTFLCEEHALFLVYLYFWSIHTYNTLHWEFQIDPPPFSVLNICIRAGMGTLWPTHAKCVNSSYEDKQKLLYVALKHHRCTPHNKYTVVFVLVDTRDEMMVQGVVPVHSP